MRLKENFMNGIDDEMMMAIIKESTTSKTPAK